MSEMTSWAQEIDRLDAKIERLQGVIRALLDELDPWLETTVFVEEHEERARLDAALTAARKAVRAARQ